MGEVPAMALPGVQAPLNLLAVEADLMMAEARIPTEELEVASMYIASLCKQEELGGRLGRLGLRARS